jgi:hypothetical protein
MNPFLRMTAVLVLVPVWAAAALADDEPLRLREPFRASYQYHVSARVELTGSLSLPPEKGQTAPRSLPIAGNSGIEYDERVLAMTDDEQVRKTARIYRRIDFQRKVGDKPQESTLRPDVRRLLLIRAERAKLAFSPDGPLTWGEVDLVRTDVFTPSLIGLLPRGGVRPGERWTATTAAVRELTDLDRVEEGSVSCRLEQVTVIGGRRQARVALSGTVRGVNEDGPNRQQLDGYYFFDLESQHLGYLYLNGISFLLDKEGKTVGRIEGRFVLTRQPAPPVAELSDEALRGRTLDPNGENTLLLFEHPELGVRFLYPRRWRVSGVHPRQVTLDEMSGNGLLVTLEAPARIPTAAQFQAEVRAWLGQQKAKILRADEPRRVFADAESFALEAEIGGQRVTMTYWIIRQPGGGATMAARLLPNDLSAVRADVEQLVRSFRVSRPIPDDTNPKR